MWLLVTAVLNIIQELVTVCHTGQRLFKNSHIILSFEPLPKKLCVIHKPSSSDENHGIKIYSNNLFFKCKE
jgi:hypothetical protein